MIVKGQIIDIDFNDSTAIVRLPIFESAGSDNIISTKAVFSTVPGAYNSYVINDVVFVGFENNQLSLPVILGKLDLGVKEEQNRLYSGSIKCDTLDAKTVSGISTSTKINIDGERDIAPGFLSKVSTVGDLVSAIQELQDKPIQQLQQLNSEETIFGTLFNTKFIYTKIITSNSNSISIADLNFDDIWVDTANSFVKGKNFSSSISDWSVDFTTKTLHIITVDPFSQGVTFVISIRYTKK